MNTPITGFAAPFSKWIVAAFILGISGANRPAQAYPPAPFHLFYGMLRDEYGTPIDNSQAEVILQTSSGVEVKTIVNSGIETASNYRLEVPMDAGLMAAPYQATALRPFVPFRIKVRIGGVTYLPMEMVGNYAELGQPGERTRINLTLGEDINGDGLPDAWQRLINSDLSKVKPGDSAGNGLTYLQTYYAGTYAASPTNGFALAIVGLTNSVPTLEFLAVKGRSYTLEETHDFATWETVEFRLSGEDTNAAPRSSFQSDAVQMVRIDAFNQDPKLPPVFFRLMLQY